MIITRKNLEVLMNKKTLEWFQERIGKRIFRKHNLCGCDVCLKVWKEGLIVQDEIHADYLFMHESETDLNYFDKQDNHDEQ